MRVDFDFQMNYRLVCLGVAISFSRDHLLELARRMGVVEEVPILVQTELGLLATCLQSSADPFRRMHGVGDDETDSRLFVEDIALCRGRGDFLQMKRRRHLKRLVVVCSLLLRNLNTRYARECE